MASQPNYRRIARNKARKYGLDPRTFQRQIKAESGFDPRAGSPAGAQGIAQIMPATAASWGVNPYKPKQALDAAAKHMAEYVKQYGSYKDALVAYNAGPGRVGLPLYAETAAYIQRILGNKPGQTELYDAKNSDAGPRDKRRTVTTKKTPDRTVTKEDPAARRAALLQYVASSDDPSALLSLATNLRSATTTKTIPGKTTRQQVKATGRPKNNDKGDGKLMGGKPGAIAEMYHDPGINIDGGSRVGAIGGHGEHVHFASTDPAVVKAAARLAIRMGLHVGENDKWDPVDPVHTDGSYHYRKFPGRKLGMAIDVSGGTAQRRLEYNRRLAKLYG